MITKDEVIKSEREGLVTLYASLLGVQSEDYILANDELEKKFASIFAGGKVFAENNTFPHPLSFDDTSFSKFLMKLEDLGAKAEKRDDELFSILTMPEKYIVYDMMGYRSFALVLYEKITEYATGKIQLEELDEESEALGRLIFDKIFNLYQDVVEDLSDEVRSTLSEEYTEIDLFRIVFNSYKDIRDPEDLKDALRDIASEINGEDVFHFVVIDEAFDEMILELSQEFAIDKNLYVQALRELRQENYTSAALLKLADETMAHIVGASSLYNENNEFSILDNLDKVKPDRELKLGGMLLDIDPSFVLAYWLGVITVEEVLDILITSYTHQGLHFNFHTSEDTVFFIKKLVDNMKQVFEIMVSGVGEPFIHNYNVNRKRSVLLLSDLCQHEITNEAIEYTIANIMKNSKLN